MKEVKLGWVARPFKSIPYQNYIQSPIGLVPKDGGTQTHLIFHLSFQFKNGGSVNFHMPREWCSVKYNDLDHAANKIWRMMKDGAKEIYFSKTDGKSAFHVLPLDIWSCQWVVMMA